MGILDSLFPDAPQGGLLGQPGSLSQMISPFDRSMAFWQGLSQMGQGMSDPRLPPGAALAGGAAGFGHGYSQSQQGALQRQLLGYAGQEQANKQKALQQFGDLTKSIPGPTPMPDPSQPVAMDLYNRMEAQRRNQVLGIASSPEMLQAMTMNPALAGAHAAILSGVAPVKVGQGEDLLNSALQPIYQGQSRNPLAQLIRIRDDPRTSQADRVAAQRDIDKQTGEPNFVQQNSAASASGGEIGKLPYAQLMAYRKAAGEAPFKVTPYQQGGGAYIGVPGLNLEGLPKIGGQPSAGAGAAVQDALDPSNLGGNFTLTPLGGGAKIIQDKGPQNKTIDTLEQKQLDVSDTRAGLQRIRESYKPEFQQLGTRAGMAVKNVKDWLNFPLSQDEQKNLTDYATYRANSASNTNQVIKTLNGTAVTPNEMQRSLLELPDAGTGVFSGDGPTVYKAKLDTAISKIDNAMMRYSYAKSNGLDPLKTGVNLEDVPKLVESEGKKIEAEIRKGNPTISEQALRLETAHRVARLFGMQ